MTVIGKNLILRMLHPIEQNQMRKPDSGRLLSITISNELSRKQTSLQLSVIQ